jgi:hypothetical protein
MPGVGVTRNRVRALGLVMRNALLGGLCALVLSACGAYTFGSGQSSPTPDSGTVGGQVLAVPCAPVEKVGSPCAGRPVGALELDYVVGTNVAGRTVTDADGRYSIRLQPGTYTVTFKSYMRIINGPTRVSVSAGANVVANYLVDSGIRLPAAAPPPR